MTMSEAPLNPVINRCPYVLTTRAETPNWRERLSCDKPRPCPDHDTVPADELDDEPRCNCSNPYCQA
jgi:hypothetical protein